MTVAEVQWKRQLVVRLLRETPEVDGPRGWAEAAVIYADVAKESIGGEECLVLDIEGKRYVLKPAVIEALYDLHQDVPRA